MNDELTVMLRQWRWMAGLALAATAVGIGLAFSFAWGEAVGTLALAAGLIIRAHQLERDISREVARMEDTTDTEP